MINNEISNMLLSCNLQFEEILPEIKRMRFINTSSVLDLIIETSIKKKAQFYSEIEKEIESMEIGTESKITINVKMEEFCG